MSFVSSTPAFFLHFQKRVSTYLAFYSTYFKHAKHKFSCSHHIKICIASKLLKHQTSRGNLNLVSNAIHFNLMPIIMKYELGSTSSELLVFHEKFLASHESFPNSDTFEPALYLYGSQVLDASDGKCSLFYQELTGFMILIHESIIKGCIPR